MNYIITLPELQTLMSLLGASAVFGFCDFAPFLTREDVVQNVAGLYKRGILIPGEEKFSCLPQVKEMLQRMISPQRVLVLTDFAATRTQFCCYCRGDRCTRMEPLPRHQNEYRLCASSAAELLESLTEDEHLPLEREKRGELQEIPELLDWDQSRLLLQAQEEGLQLLVEIYDMPQQRLTARGVVLQREEDLILTHCKEGKRSARYYRRAELLGWIQHCMGVGLK